MEAAYTGIGNEGREDPERYPRYALLRTMMTAYENRFASMAKRTDPARQAFFACVWTLAHRMGRLPHLKDEDEKKKEKRSLLFSPTAKRKVVHGVESAEEKVSLHSSKIEWKRASRGRL